MSRYKEYFTGLCGIKNIIPTKHIATTETANHKLLKLLLISSLLFSSKDIMSSNSPLIHDFNNQRYLSITFSISIIHIISRLMVIAIQAK